jgi:hypothetical protein
MYSAGFIHKVEQKAKEEEDIRKEAEVQAEKEKKNTVGYSDCFAYPTQERKERRESKKQEIERLIEEFCTDAVVDLCREVAGEVLNDALQVDTLSK